MPGQARHDKKEAVIAGLTRNPCLAACTHVTRLTSASFIRALAWAPCSIPKGLADGPHSLFRPRASARRVSPTDRRPPAAEPLSDAAARGAGGRGLPQTRRRAATPQRARCKAARDRDPPRRHAQRREL